MNLPALLAPVWRGTAYYAKRENTATPSPAHHRSADGRFTRDPDGRVRNMHSDAEAARWAGERSDVLAWLPQGASVYDLGCGDGKLCLARPDLDVFGYDLDGEAEARAMVRGTRKYDLRPVDALWCCHVIEHMERPQTDIGYAIHAVRSGGLVIVETPDFGSPVALEWGDRFRLLHDPTHISLFTTESLMRMLRALGVEIEEVAFPGYFGTPLQERRGELYRQYPGTPGEERHKDDASPPAPGNVVAIRGRKL